MHDISRTYLLYCKQLKAYAMTFISYEEAEDVVQEVFSRLLVSKAEFNTERELRNYLYLSVRNKCLDALKHKAVVREFINEASQNIDSDTEDEMFAGEIYARLFSHIDSLPRRQRETLLQMCEGKSNAEIAVAMNVSMETVKNQKYKAILTLKNLLKDMKMLLVAASTISYFKYF